MPFVLPVPEMQASDHSLSSFATEHPLQYLWGVAAVLICGVATLILGVLAFVSVPLLRSTRVLDFIAWFWSVLVLRVCGITVEVEGTENLEAGRSYVIISNHQSFFDVWATLATAPRVIRFVAKKELLKVPGFGPALGLSDHIVIDRKDPQGAIETIDRAVRNAPSGIGILFYAEGTRSTDGKIQAFKKGGVTLALRSALPIVPLSVSGSGKIFPKGAYVVRPGGRVRLAFGKPIETRGITADRRDELNEEVRRAVIAGFIESY